MPVFSTTTCSGRIGVSDSCRPQPMTISVTAEPAVPVVALTAPYAAIEIIT